MRLNNCPLVMGWPPSPVVGIDWAVLAARSTQPETAVLALTPFTARLQSKALERKQDTQVSLASAQVANKCKRLAEDRASKISCHRNAKLARVLPLDGQGCQQVRGAASDMARHDLELGE